MHLLLNIVFAVQMLAAIAMVALILVQHGKGADMGAAFGSGSAGSVFGSSGSANFLSHTTAVLATVFLLATLTLAYFGNQRPVNNSVGSVLETPAGAVAPKPAETAPAAPAAPAPGAGTSGTGTDQIPTK
ncbi:MAG: preprotein translocase subunit SecG [Comamonadaceae bacterium]|nr:preprotein translocase subunit SecG [Burkholderiales bacterium]MEB2348739.1 preprotein translocase subunit SecG [Comamonadaceae bacterium]